MQNNKDNTQPYTGTGTGQQGVDKAPGEETANQPVNFTVETQKGKTVDADVEDAADRPPAGQDI